MHNRWFTPRAVKLHLLALFAVCACLALGYWQFTRAYYAHNGLSWAYTFEWPFFAAYAGWMWWKLLHEEPGFKQEVDDPEARRRAEERRRREQEELAAYNEHLARLSSERNARR